MEQILVMFLRALKIPVSSQYVRKITRSHPDYPSLLSTSDALYRLGIEHAVHRTDAESLADLSFPYLLLFDSKPLLITRAADLDRYKDELKHWAGIVLQATPQGRSRDKVNNRLVLHESRLRTCLTAIALIVAGSILFLFLNSFSGLISALLLSATLGAIAGYFLVAKTLGIVHETVEAFCRSGENSNCDSVVKTKLNLMGVGLPDAVVLYFSFQFILLVLAQTSSQLRHTHLQQLAWLSMLSLPVIIFSLYYQYAVVKSWCRLCLLVIAVLVIQAIVFGMATRAGYINVFDVPPPRLLLLPFTILSSLILILSALKTAVKRANELASVGGSGDRVKHAPAVFVYLLSLQTGIDNDAFEYEMVLGNAVAPLSIMMVTNLYCTPCKAKHGLITELLEQYPGQIRVVLRFVPGGHDDEARLATVPYLLHYWLTRIHGGPDEFEQTEKMISTWFSVGDLTAFKEQYPQNMETQDTAKKLMEQHYTWAKKMGIDSTPTVFVNGHSIPKEYTMEEVVMMAPGLADWFENMHMTAMQNA